MSDMVKNIKNRLLELAEPEYAAFSSKLTPGANLMLGVRIPILRSLAKEIANESWKEYLENAADDTFEEVMIQGLVLGYVKKESIESLFPYLDDFVKKINNWSVCDCVCAGLKIAKKEQVKVWEYLQKYFRSTEEFELRFAIVMGMDYFINDEYVEEYLDIISNISHEGYYVKMAVAWALSVAYVRYPERMYMYFTESELDNFTHNKAIQKIRESYRVSQEEKDKLILLKRKK